MIQIKTHVAFIEEKIVLKNMQRIKKYYYKYTNTITNDCFIK